MKKVIIEFNFNDKFNPEEDKEELYNLLGSCLENPHHFMHIWDDMKEKKD